jgi:predicted aspartyl protease
MKDISTNRISRKQFLKLMVSGFFILFLFFIPNGFFGGGGAAIKEIFPMFNHTPLPAQMRALHPRAKSNIVEATSETNLETEGNCGPPIFNPDGSVSYPIKFIKDGDYTETRTLLKVQMQVKDGSWKSAVFNIDTGATVTDVPPILLKDFDIKVSSKRLVIDVKCRIPGLREFVLPCTIPDKSHYDDITQDPTKYPLMKTEDMMKYMSIVFEQKKTTFRPKSLGPPPEINNPHVVRLADAARHSGTPTSSKYWYKWKAYPLGKPQNAETDWWLLDTGANSLLVKKSYADDIGLVREKKIADGRYLSTITVEFAKGKNFTAKCEIRSDKLQFARGGPPRNLGGRIGFLDIWSIVVWDNHVAIVPSINRYTVG